VVSKAVNESFHENINYDEIVIINRDENDRIDSIQTDIVKLNRIYADLSLDIQKKLLELSEEKYQFLWGRYSGNLYLLPEDRKSMSG